MSNNLRITPPLSGFRPTSQLSPRQHDHRVSYRTVQDIRQAGYKQFLFSQFLGARICDSPPLARAGDIRRAKALAEELEKSYPTNTLLKLYWLPTINAANELSSGNSSQALVLLEAAAPYELAGGLTLYPAYVRGQAYLRAHNGTAATAEFQKLLDHSGIMLNFVTGAVSHLQIGRAYAMAGDTARAKAAYQVFLTFWKDADTDIPILKEAKTEYAKLQ